MYMKRANTNSMIQTNKLLLLSFHIKKTAVYFYIHLIFHFQKQNQSTNSIRKRINLSFFRN